MSGVNQLDWAGILRTRSVPGDLTLATFPAGTAALVGPGSSGAGVFNILDYGGDATGAEQSSTAAQAAADAIEAAGRGILLIPPGEYLWDATVYLPSNTVVSMYGAKINTVAYSQYTPASDGPTYAIFVNKNFEQSLQRIDENIEVWGGVLNYSGMGTVPGGGAHALHFQGVTNVKVGYGELLYGEDYIACRYCSDVLVIGCSAYDFENCAWDFWWGCDNVRVIGCYSESGDTVQHANFQCSTFYPTGQVADRFIMQGCTMVHPAGGTKNFSSVFLDPFGTGNITRNVIFQGCQFRNVIIAIRGYIEDVLVQGCQFSDNYAGTSPVLSYADAGNTPTRITVDNCTFLNPATAAPNVAVIDLRGTNCRVTNNIITGTAYSTPAVVLGTGGLQFSNTVDGTYGPSNTQSSGSRIVGGGGDGRGFGLGTATGSTMRWFVQDDDQMVLYGVNAAGDASRLAASWQQHSDTGVWSWGVEVRHGASLLRTVSSNLTATGTVRTDSLSLTAQFNNVTTVAAGTGVRLINRENGELVVRVRNGGANALNVYPFNGPDQIDALGAGNPYSLPAGSVGTWCLTTSGQWYTVAVHP